MLKNFCFCPAQYCSTTSQTSFNYHTLKGTAAAAVSSTLQRHLDRSSGPILDAAVGFKNDRTIGRFTIERSCSSSCRSNSIDAGEDSGGGAFTFLSSSTTATTTTAATTANNSIHFYHPKSIQTNSPTTSSSSSSSSSSSTSCSRETTDEDVVNPGGSNNNKKQDNNSNVAVSGVGSKSSAAAHGLVSNLTPLSESIRVQIQQRSQSNSNNNNNNSNTSNQNNKENVRSTSRTTNSRLVTSTAVINLKPSPPITQPPSLDGE